MMRSALGLFCFGLCLATIKSQFIEISRDVIHVGDDVILKCFLANDEQNSKDDANYVWYLNNKKVISNEHFEQRGNELLMNNAMKHLTGYYSCVVEFVYSGAKLETPHEYLNIIDREQKHESNHDKLDSPCGFRIPKLCRNKRNKNEEARLNFTTKPLSTKNLDLGFSSKIHCKAALSTKIYWTKDPDQVLPEDVEDLNGTLIFNNVKLDHKGNYTCVASNDEESINTTVEVRILPKFDISPPSNLEVVELQSVHLDCSASGSPEPSIKWDHETIIINTKNEDNEDMDGRFRIFENGTLLIQEARQDDAGIYGCLAGSSAGFKRAETVLIVRSMDSHSSFEDANREDGFLMSKAVLMTCLVAFIYISLVVALMLWCRNKRLKSRAEDPENNKENDDTASDGDHADEKEPLNHETKPSRTNNKVHQHKEKQKKLATSPSSTLIIDHLMIHYDRLLDLTKLGRGEFGEVLVGAVLESDVSIKSNQHHVVENENGTDVNEIQAQQRVHVLVKSLSKIKDESFFIEFRRQIDLHRAVDSINVVKLFALCFEKDHHFMVLEHSQELRTYLAEHQDTSTQSLIKLCRQIACGLDAIAKSKLTHRDIALRNCIITSSLVVKLSSISLCKDKHANEYFKHNNRNVPLRHLAPEIFQSSTFSTASDVFAVGMTIWEVMNLGTLPFAATPNDELFQIIQNKVIDYSTLSDKVPKLKKLLLQCWSASPNERPKPEDIIKSLDTFITNDENGDIKEASPAHV